jgi:hypothetical protein
MPVAETPDLGFAMWPTTKSRLWPTDPRESSKPVNVRDGDELLAPVERIRDRGEFTSLDESPYLLAGNVKDVGSLCDG